MVQAIFFDVYGTLAGFRPDRFEIQSEACSRFGMKLTREGVLRGYALADVFMSEQNAVKPVRMMNDEERARFFGEYERRVSARMRLRRIGGTGNGNLASGAAGPLRDGTLR